MSLLFLAGLVCWLWVGVSGWTVLPNTDAVTKGTSVGHWSELTNLKSLDECEAAATKGTSVNGKAVNVTIFSWNGVSKHCYLRYDNQWVPISNPKTTSGCLSGVVPHCPPSPTPPPPPPGPPPPPPPPSPPPPSPPTPPSPPPPPVVLKHTSFVAPQGKVWGCGGSPQGAMIGNVAYFLPTSSTSSPVITAFDVVSSTWSYIPIPPTSGVMSMLAGVSMAAVDPGPGIGGSPFLVVSGGGTNRVVAYNLNTKNWTMQKGLEHNIKNSCSVGCRGLFFTMTGDFVKAATETFKPSDRQIYSYNLTTGLQFENNGEKTRGGAGCACGEEAGVVFFAGGFSDAGVTSGVEVWRTPLARRGEPKLDMGQHKRDLGGVGCGGKAVFAGGTDGGKVVYDTVQVFPTVLNATNLNPVTYKLGVPLKMPRVGCIGDRYTIISGGFTNEAGCNRNVYVLDTALPPKSGSTLPAAQSLNATGAVAVAHSSTSGPTVFFDGAVLDVYGNSS